MPNNLEKAKALDFLMNFKKESDKDSYHDLSSALSVAIQSIKDVQRLGSKPQCLSCKNRDCEKDVHPCCDCYLTSSYVSNYQLRDEFDDFLDRVSEETKDSAVGEYCIHGGISGGPGYIGFASCKIHGNVRYGQDMCPKHCKDFELTSEDKLMDVFKCCR